MSNLNNLDQFSFLEEDLDLIEDNDCTLINSDIEKPRTLKNEYDIAKRSFSPEEIKQDFRQEFNMYNSQQTMFMMNLANQFDCYQMNNKPKLPTSNSSNSISSLANYLDENGSCSKKRS